jgi:hypothetical protein
MKTLYRVCSINKKYICHTTLGFIQQGLQLLFDKDRLLGGQILNGSLTSGLGTELAIAKLQKVFDKFAHLSYASFQSRKLLYAFTCLTDIHGRGKFKVCSDFVHIC